MKTIMNKKSVILLSGGLDSLISLATLRNELDIKLALTFDYGQKAFNNEFKAASDICKYYNIKHEVISLDWLKKISKSALNCEKELPLLDKNELNNKIITVKSAESVWVPNRNALFINIAACFAESYKYKYIIIGANKEEGATFKDNSLEFIQAINDSLKNSANSEIEVTAPLINYDKNEIVKLGLNLKAPFNLIYSCYNTQVKKHCGKCESCLRLKRALELNNRNDIISQLF